MHRSVRSVVPRLLLAFLVSGAVLYLGSLLPSSAGLIAFRVFGEDFRLTLPLSLLICLVLILRPLLLILNERYEIGCYHLRAVSGCYSLRREEVEIP